MRKVTTLMAVAMLATLPLAGCIENMDDLKERIQGASADDATKVAEDTVNDATGQAGANVNANATANATKDLKPPVARVTIFAANGALAYRASFVAENQTDPVFITAGDVTLIAADSEAVNAGATLEKFEWTIQGKKENGRKVTVNLSEPGLYMVALKVTDSLGSSDDQMVHIAIAPVPFEETVTLTGGPVVGQDPLPTARGTNAFTVLAEKDGKALTVLNVKVVLHASETADLILEVTDPAGTTAHIDGGFVATAEEFQGSGPAGEWTATVLVFAGAAPEYTIDVTVTYVQVVEGLGGGDGHAGH